MTTTTRSVAEQYRATQDFKDRVSDALSDRDDLANTMLASNTWDGVDAHFADGTTLRATPIDGEWEAGFEVHYLSQNRVLLASMTVQAGHYSPAFVAQCAASLLNAEDDS